MDNNTATLTNPTTEENPFSTQAGAARSRRGAELGAFRPHWGERLGGIALIAAPILLAGGILTSPQQAEDGTAGYIASLAADPGLSLASANLLHYGWVALVFGALATIGLLRGRAGRIWVPLAAAITAFGAIQMSGLLLSDWFQIGAGNTVPMADAVAISDGSMDPSVMVWRFSGMAAGILGAGFLALALAKARAISWWIAPLAFLPWLMPMVVPAPFSSVLTLVCFLPLIVAGMRLVRAR